MKWNISLSNPCNSPTLYFLASTDVTTKTHLCCKLHKGIAIMQKQNNKSPLLLWKKKVQLFRLHIVWLLQKGKNNVLTHIFYCLSIKSHLMTESTHTHVNTATFVSICAQKICTPSSVLCNVFQERISCTLEATARLKKLLIPNSLITSWQTATDDAIFNLCMSHTVLSS